MFIVALFTQIKRYKQPKCPSTDEWIYKMLYIHTTEYYSAIKNKYFFPSSFREHKKIFFLRD